MAATTLTAKPHYVSFSLTEFDALHTVGFRERWLYAELKWKANFKTGVVGSFHRECLTYAKLAELVSVPEQQGRDRGLCSIDDKEAARLIERLEAAGLVANLHRNARGGLSFTLPLSPIGAKPTSQPLPASALPAEKMPDDWGSDDDASPQPVGHTGEFDASRSILKNSSKDLKTFSNDISNAGAADTATPRLAEKPPATLTLPFILSRLNASGARFVYLGTDTSHQLYAGWLERGVTLQAFEQAVGKIEGDAAITPTPMAVDALLRGQQKGGGIPGRINKRGTPWGRVSL